MHVCKELACPQILWQVYALMLVIPAPCSILAFCVDFATHKRLVAFFYADRAAVMLLYLCDRHLLLEQAFTVFLKVVFGPGVKLSLKHNLFWRDVKVIIIVRACAKRSACGSVKVPNVKEDLACILCKQTRGLRAPAARLRV
jgi:hypothetical protein